MAQSSRPADVAGSAARLHIAFKSRSLFYKDFLNLAPHVPALDDPQHEDAARRSLAADASPSSFP
jgi:hypothetical protein